MITLTIDDNSSIGRQIYTRAKAAGLTPLAILHGLAYDAFSKASAAGAAPSEPAPAAQPTAKVPTSAPSPVRNLANSDPELPELAPLTPANEGMDLLAFADSLDASRVIS